MTEFSGNGLSFCSFRDSKTILEIQIVCKLKSREDDELIISYIKQEVWIKCNPACYIYCYSNYKEKLTLLYLMSEKMPSFVNWLGSALLRNLGNI